jgi:hypothetical protein
LDATRLSSGGVERTWIIIEYEEVALIASRCGDFKEFVRVIRLKARTSDGLTASMKVNRHAINVIGSSASLVCVMCP